MRYVISFFAMAVVAFGMVFFIQAQESAKRRTPKLTNDDIVGTPSPINRSPTAPSNSSIQWQTDLDRALNLAKSNRSKVIVDVYTDWCGWCKKMDKDIYTSPKIVALSDTFVFLKLNAEDGGQGERFARDMSVRGYPTTIVLDENGRSVNLIRGYPRSLEQFLNTLESAR